MAWVQMQLTRNRHFFGVSKNKSAPLLAAVKGLTERQLAAGVVAVAHLLWFSLGVPVK